MVVNRILEQWGALQIYFSQQYLEHRLQSSEYIFKGLHDIEIKLFYFFLQWVLPKFSDLNKYFQNEKVVITTVHERVSETYKTLLLSYMDSKYVNKHALQDIDPENSNHFLELQNIYLGVEIIKNLSQLNETQKINFLSRCRQFLIIGCLQIKKRFDFENSFLLQLATFNPKSTTRPNSIYSIIKFFPRVINPEKTELIQKIDDEWRLYCQCIVDFSDEIKNENEPDKYWYKVSKVSDVAGTTKFENLGKFVLDLFVFPHSNATCERVFSKVNLIKTKIRNRLCTKTINGLVLASEGVKECYSFQTSEIIFNLMKNMNSSSSTEEEEQ